jgi:glycerol uptake facilitator
MTREPLIAPSPSLPARCVAEALGTFMLVFFGCGVVHAAVLTGAQVGLWQVAIVWGIAILTAILVVGKISGAHINPAITVAMAVWRGFPWREVPAYFFGQLTGAMVAALALFTMFGTQLAERERDLGIARGGPGSEMTAMCYGEFYPNPGGIAARWKDRRAMGLAREATSPEAFESYLREERAGVSEYVASFAEFLGTLLLALVVSSVTDSRNSAATLTSVVIGLTVAILISVIAPLTQACFNPARDFGPRLVSYFAGWGEAALPGPNGRGFFTVYILSPVLGAIAGGGLQRLLLAPAYPRSEPSSNGSA